MCYLCMKRNAQQSRRAGVSKDMTRLHKYVPGLLAAMTAAGFLLFSSLLAAQQEIPDKPDIIRVTVDHSDNGVLIQWEPSTDTTVDRYILYKLNPNQQDFDSIFQFSANTLEYKHMTSGLKNLSYTLTAYDIEGDRESLLGENVHRAMTTTALFDPCTPANLVTWSPYIGWEGKLSGYGIYRSSGDGSYQDLGFVSPGTSSFTDDEIILGNSYSYFIKAFNTSSDTSFSTVDTVGSFLPPPPGHLEVDYVSVVDRSTMEVQFSADISGTINDFRVMRRSSPASPYLEVASVENMVQPDHMIVDQVHTAVESYEYKVQSIYRPETCPEGIVISESLPRSSILLNGSLENQVVSLSWTPWRDYLAGISGYIVQRMNGTEEFFDIQTLGPGDHTWNEPVESLINGFQSGEIKYRILAVGISGSTGAEVISESNTLTLQVETNLRVPSAFTPGSNDMNSEFRPMIDFAPGKYVMIIFDRSGRKLFETTDPGEGWDGRFGDGNFVDEGVYVYYIQYTDYTGIYRSYTGNVTILYP
jgi:gliding motility-associated-like protein